MNVCDLVLSDYDLSVVTSYIWWIWCVTQLWLIFDAMTWSFVTVVSRRSIAPVPRSARARPCCPVVFLFRSRRYYIPMNKSRSSSNGRPPLFQTWLNVWWWEIFLSFKSSSRNSARGIHLFFIFFVSFRKPTGRTNRVVISNSPTTETKKFLKKFWRPRKYFLILLKWIRKMSFWSLNEKI